MTLLAPNQPVGSLFFNNHPDSLAPVFAPKGGLSHRLPREGNRLVFVLITKLCLPSIPFPPPANPFCLPPAHHPSSGRHTTANHPQFIHESVTDRIPSMEMETAQVKVALTALRQILRGVRNTQEGQTLRIRPRQYRPILQRRRSSRRRRNRPPPLQTTQINHNHPTGQITEYPPSPLSILPSSTPSSSRPLSPSPSACDECPDSPHGSDRNEQGEQPEWRLWQQLRAQEYTGRIVFERVGNAQTEHPKSQATASVTRPQTPPRQIHNLTFRTRSSSRENTPNSSSR
ncbi:hypothetical protein QBC40DRAFT_97457 [Triangularia verruculosa]|uniref:Uncharacterized protein n=1 Tax=Triangularia verruculosa TaxID=2587418 RepID=A0AAN6XED3_9PEZI|nr:hypothetical protein QBC40DRAFT_97457 [Triangularia verruculosa]